MNKFAKWLKNHIFYTFLAVLVAVALIGYHIWLTHPIPLIPDDAENLRMAEVGFNGGDYAPFLIISETGGDSSRQVFLSDEGTEKMFSELKKYSSVCVWSRPDGGQITNPYTIRLGIQYEQGGITYGKILWMYHDCRVDLDPVVKEGIKIPLTPLRNHPAVLAGGDASFDALYSAIIDIIETYELPEGSDAR